MQPAQAEGGCSSSSVRKWGPIAAIVAVIAIIAGVLVAQDFLNVTGNPNSDYTGFIVSSMLLGAFVATFPAALLADRFSRRSAIMVAALIFLLGGGLQAGAQNRHMMMAGRFFAGCGIGQM